MARVAKKAQEGTNIVPIRKPRTVSLRGAQERRLGRLSAKNPAKAEKVAGKMVERRTRRERGREYIKKNVEKLYPEVPTLKRGGGLPDFNKDGKITKKDVLIGRGVLPKTAKRGTSMKKQAAIAIAMKKAGKSPKKKMMGGGMARPMMRRGGKCRYGC